MTTSELFQKIREAPGMYLAPPSAKTLGAFLSGYQMGLAAPDSDLQRFSKHFGNWLSNRLNVNSSQHWTKIIEFYSMTQNQEMDLFWKLYDEFELKSKRKRKSATSDRPETVKS